MAHLTEEILKLNPTAIIEMFELDLTTLGDTVYYFYAGTNESYQDMVWQGNTYSALPIEAEGFDISTEGTSPIPIIRISNILGTIGQLCSQYNDLLNAKVTRRRTMMKYLDAINFEGGVNPDADPTIGFEDDTFFVNRKSKEDFNTVEFELSVPWDVEGIQLPRRQIIKNLCYWKYRGTECGYSGGPVADQYDQPVTDIEDDKCSKTLSGGCTARFGQGPKPFGGFPAAGFIR